MAPSGSNDSYVEHTRGPTVSTHHNSINKHRATPPCAMLMANSCTAIQWKDYDQIKAGPACLYPATNSHSQGQHGWCTALCSTPSPVPGRTLGPSLLGVLLRFRLHAIAVSGDIQSMFHQVRLLPFDCSVLRFLWRNMQWEEEPTIYEWQVLPFGTTCSPCCAI